MLLSASLALTGLSALALASPTQPAVAQSGPTAVVFQKERPAAAIPSAVTISPKFPASAFASYWPGFEPTQTTAQVQPVVSDPVTGRIYELNLTNPHTIPGNDTVDIIQWPNPIVKNSTLNSAYGIAKISKIIKSNSTSPCQRCIDSLRVAQDIARSNPWELEDLATELCIQFSFASAESCRNMYTRFTYAPILAQTLFHADLSSASPDGVSLCRNFVSASQCPYPAASPLDLDAWFSKPRPTDVVMKKPSGKMLKVLHSSDWHLDPRYLTGSEASCSSGLCCRAGGFNKASPNVTVLPAPVFGAFTCDSPYSLVLAALQAVPALTNTSAASPFAFSILTGDIVSHDPANTLSRSWVEYTEAVMYRLVKEFTNGGPVYAAIGNHDQFQQAQDAPHSIQPGVPIEEQLLSWNYQHLASLWEHEGWITEDVAKASVAHYGAYATTTQCGGLKIITLNTDLWYRANFYSYINSANPDSSGQLHFLTDELQKSEDIGQKVWIVGHVLPGWDGSNAMNNPTNLYYQIVDRYSPHVIAGTFFGHVHEDYFSIYYRNNGTIQNENTAVNVAWMGPSIVPLTNLNAGFRMYEVDSATFEVHQAHTWYSNVSEYATLTGGPSWHYEYNMRTAYDPNCTWPADAPLNGSFFHRVTTNIETQPSLMSLFTHYQGKSSLKTASIQPCNTTACLQAKVCYMRSSSVALGKACPQGFGSVQS